MAFKANVIYGDSYLESKLKNRRIIIYNFFQKLKKKTFT